jgi:hypothetical protein
MPARNVGCVPRTPFVRKTSSWNDSAWRARAIENELRTFSADAVRAKVWRGVIAYCDVEVVALDYRIRRIKQTVNEKLKIGRVLRECAWILSEFETERNMNRSFTIEVSSKARFADKRKQILRGVVVIAFADRIIVSQQKTSICAICNVDLRFAEAAWLPVQIDLWFARAQRRTTNSNEQTFNHVAPFSRTCGHSRRSSYE